MSDFNLNRGVGIYQMLSKCPKIRRSVLDLAKRIITMLYTEHYKPSSVEFMAMSPAGEPNKIMLILDKAEYTDENVIEPVVQPSDPSYKMVSFVDSLYKAIVGNNGAMQGIYHCCPGLATATYAVANYLYSRWYVLKGRDIPRDMVWDSFDWWVSKDLMIVSTIND